MEKQNSMVLSSSKNSVGAECVEMIKRFKEANIFAQKFIVQKFKLLESIDVL